jgi:hypothetical protein
MENDGDEVETITVAQQAQGKYACIILCCMMICTTAIVITCLIRF